MSRPICVPAALGAALAFGVPSIAFCGHAGDADSGSLSTLIVADQTSKPADAGSGKSRSLATATSDAAITAEVKSKLLADSDVAGSRIDVDTRNKVVTLSGTVSSAAESTRAVAIAAQVEGVGSVSNRLTVAGAEGGNAGSTASRDGSTAADAMITAKVKTRLLADPDVAGLKIDVDTRASVVTLTGTVASEDQAARAVALASEVKGVSNVDNRLLPAQ